MYGKQNAIRYVIKLHLIKAYHRIDKIWFYKNQYTHNHPVYTYTYHKSWLSELESTQAIVGHNIPHHLCFFLVIKSPVATDRSLHSSFLFRPGKYLLLVVIPSASGSGKWHYQRTNVSIYSCNWCHDLFLNFGISLNIIHALATRRVSVWMDAVLLLTFW